MDTYDAIVTKLDVRQFASKKVSGETMWKVLEAARLTGSAMNTQNWRFILVKDRANLKKLAGDSTTGKWIEGADFAIIVLTDPALPGHPLDAGRVVQDMELAAWDFGVASGLYVGVKQDQLQKDFAIPANLKISAILGFGYPKEKIIGKKNRKPLEEIAFSERHGEKLDIKSLK